MRILLAGGYGEGQPGAEETLGALLGFLRELCPEPRVEVASADPVATGALHGAAAVRITDWRAMADAVRQADGVVVSGTPIRDLGPSTVVDLFNAPPGSPALLLGVALLARALDRPVLHLAQRVEPPGDAEGAAMARLFFSLGEAISVRDAESVAVLRRLGIPSEEVVTAALAGQGAGRHWELLVRFIAELPDPRPEAGFHRRSPPEPALDRDEAQQRLDAAEREVERLSGAERELQRVYRSRTWRVAVALRGAWRAVGRLAGRSPDREGRQGA